MTSTFQLLLGGSPAPQAVLAALGALEVEESVEHPSAFELELGVSRSDSGDLTFVDEPALAPYADIAIVAQSETGLPECIFEGHVLTHTLRLAQNVVDARLRVAGQDASWRMNLEEKTREWVGVSEGSVANTIFGEHGFATDPNNTSDDSPIHAESGRSLMQRATDLQFLKSLARRSGKHCRVVSGAAPGLTRGVFAAPQLGQAPVTTLALHGSRPTVQALELQWDVMRPTEITTRTALHDDPAEDGVSGDTTDGGLAALGARTLATYAGRPMKARLTTITATSAGLQQRARAVLRDAGFFVRCTGEADVAQLGAVLRAGTVVAVSGAGATCSGHYYVWSVRHHISGAAHRMSFVLVSNALGQPGGGP